MSIEIDTLRRIPLFAHLDQEELTQIAPMIGERYYERGDLIVLEGELGGALHYVHTGLVKVFKTSPSGKEQVLRLIATGHTFNDVPALDGGPNPASAAAVERSTIYAIRRVELHMLIRTHPKVAEAVVHMLTNALRHLVGLVEDLSLRHVTARVARLLLEQDEAVQHAQPVYHLTQQEMAALVGTAREVVGRSLKELEVAGAIEMHQGRAVVINHERLQFLASE